MANLLRFVHELVTDEAAREAFRADPTGAIDRVEGADVGFTGEDVDAVLRLVRRHLGPPLDAQIEASAPNGTAPDEDPTDAVLRHLHAICASADVSAGTSTATAAVGSGGEALPDHPPGPSRRLWAVDGAGEPEGAEAEHRVDPTHPSAGGSREIPDLSAVPEPDGGFAFDPLEMVRLVRGLPDHGIDAGELATVISRRAGEEGRVDYEIEVSAPDGGRRFLGVVPASEIERA